MSSISGRGSKLTLLINLQPGEGRPVWLLGSLYFLLVLGFVFIQSITFGLFIAEFGAQNLPYAYLSIAALASLVALAYLKLSERIPFNRLLYLNLGFITLVCLAYWGGLWSPFEHWVIFLLPFWFQTMINLANLVVWPLAGRIFDVRQAKRLFGLVGAGNWMANVLGGIIVAPLVGLLGAPNLMLLAAVATLAALLVLRMIIRIFLSQPAQATGRRPSSTQSQVRRNPLKEPFIRLIFVYIVLWWVSFYFVDNIFYIQAGLHYPNAAQLAGFIGHLLSAIGIIALVTTTFITSRVISRYGLRTGLLVMPSLVGIDIAALAVIGTLSPGNPTLFWLAVLAKLVSVALGFSLSQASSTLLYQALPVERRGYTQTMAEGIVQPLAIGLAGLALLLFNTLLGLRAVGLSWIFLPIVASWLVAILLVSRQYPSTMAQTLARRQLGETPISLSDPDSRSLLEQSLNSQQPGAVLFALDRLEGSDPSAFPSILAKHLSELLTHPHPLVRGEVLQRLENLDITSAVPEIIRLLEVESEATVRAAAIRACLALDGRQAFELAVASLSDPRPLVQRGALVGLMRYGGVDGILAAGETFSALVSSPHPEQRRSAAEILASVNARNFYQPLEILLADKSPRVKRASLKAAGKVAHPRLWPTIVQACAYPESHHAAVQALIMGGSSALPAIEAAFNTPGQPPLLLAGTAQACGTIKSPNAVHLLVDKIDHPDEKVRTSVYQALSACGYHAPASDERLQRQLRLETDLAAQLYADMLSLGEDARTALLQKALESAVARSRDRVLYLLSFLYSAQPILRARETFALGQASQLAYALELVETQIPASLKGLILPMLEDLPPEERLSRWKTVDIQPAGMSLADCLEAILAGPNATRYPRWARACAAYVAGALQIAASGDALQLAAADPDPLICETARWALTHMSLSLSEGEQAMLSTLEKVIILKSAGVFSRVPDEVLAEVATLLEEIEITSQEAVFCKDEPGDSLYVVIEGRVRIHDGDRNIQVVVEGEVFGEMALLDPEPRSASATTLEPTRLLRLDQEPFIELLNQRPEVAIGIIRVLTQRLRSRMQDLSAVGVR